jgi:phage host-nuclease inhibitor protein Gam
MHTQIIDITLKSPNNKIGRLKSSSGEMLIEKAKIVQRWAESYKNYLTMTGKTQTHYLMKKDHQYLLQR